MFIALVGIVTISHVFAVILWTERNKFEQM